MGLRDLLGFSRRSPQLSLPAETDSIVSTMDAMMVHNDVWSNPVTGLGGRNSRAACNVFRFQAPRDPTELDNLYEFNPLAARIVDREPDDCVRMGFTVKELDAESQQDLDERLSSLNMLCKISDAHRWSRVFGGALVFVQVQDGLDPIKPVDFTKIREVTGLSVYDSLEALPVLFDRNPNSKTANMPIVYQISSDGISFAAHRSRCLIFDGVKLTPRRRRDRNGWGGSYLAQVWKSLEQYDVTHAYLNEAISQITQGVLKLGKLNASMKKQNASLLANRINGLKRAMSVLGDIALDADENESYEVHQRPVTGFKEAAEVFVDQLVAASGYPKTILFGQTPGGLNSGINAGDWTTWNTHIGARQLAVYTPQVLAFLRILLSAADAPVSVDSPARLSIVWSPLQESSDVEKSTQLVQVANAGNTLFIAGAISSDEMRNHRLVRSEFEISADDAGDDSLEAPQPSRTPDDVIVQPAIQESQTSEAESAGQAA